jgi:hypothetical protein
MLCLFSDHPEMLAVFCGFYLWIGSDFIWCMGVDF